MKRIVFLLISAIFINPALAQTKFNLVKATITFKIKNLGINTGGTLGGVTANISFDKDKPESSSIEATADVNQLNTDNEAKDKHLKSADYFDAAKYPKITMRSVSLTHTAGSNYAGVFNLTIKDKTKPVTVPFTYIANGSAATFKGGFKILRTDFGIGGKSLVLGNDVTVDIIIETAR